MTPPPSPDRAFIEGLALPALRALATYHRYRVVGLEHVPNAGPAIFLLTHSMATYDLFLLYQAIYRHNGRVLRGLGDRLWFRVPGLGAAIERIGTVEAAPGAARAILAAGGMVGLPPGGMREALRPSSERFEVRWKGRTGFARLALEARAPVILGACPAADLVYTLRDNRLTSWAYETYKIPVPVMTGLGPSWLPRPVRLTHYLASPLVPPAARPDDPEAVAAFRECLELAMRDLIAEAVERDGLRGPRRRHGSP